MSEPSTRPALYKGFRFPPEIISHCVWLYYRFGVSLRDVSELMLARGIQALYEAIQLWTLRFCLEYTRGQLQRVRPHELFYVARARFDEAKRALTDATV